MANLTFYGGVAKIGGNKILLEDRDARIWLDMGAPFDLGEEFFVEFLGPRERFGLRDHFALDLMPRIRGLYSAEVLDPTDMAWEPPAFSAIFISHVHYDHTQHLRYVDPNVPVYLGEGARTILESLDTTARQPALRLGAHPYTTFRSGNATNIDGVEVEPIHVDHSAPAAYGFLVHTSEGAVAYTGDLRHHGPMKTLTEDFIEAARAAKPVVLITEGTRVAPDDPRENLSESDVKAGAIRLLGSSKDKLALVTFPPRDVDRIRTFAEAARAVGRKFVLNAKTAHLLLTLKKDTHIRVPDLQREDDLLLYDRLMRNAPPWERELQLKLKDRVVTSEALRARPSEYLVQLDFWHLPELVDLQPPAGSPFIHSKSEPFEEDDVNDAVLQRWLDRFQLVRHQLHASGHLSEREVGEMIEAIAPKLVIPVHTEYPGRFTSLAPHVLEPRLFEPTALR
ncbi:MAG: MBL fold metallo-hydrolase [Thermoplasmata archaeon]|nr:MBL fold metallo-hydrolase [Thermoplasmata archaeon]